MIELAHAELLPELSRAHIAKLFRAAAAEVPIPADLAFSLAFVSSEEMRAINKTYRGNDKPTDVLSFRYSDNDAEILLAPDVVRSQAHAFQHDITLEASFLLVHGILHVLGWDHERSQKEKKEMELYEQRILQRCGLDYPR